MATNFIQVTPFLNVRDVEAAVAFFTGILGFEVPFRQPGYAYLEREGVGFRVLEAEGDEAPPGNRRITAYVDVRDVDGLYQELKPRLAGLPAGDVLGPTDQAYGQRELMVRGPDGNVIAFGQPIKKG
jgi:catechol 2,3-dioxygenase-like lactoylglutathione lyase family enzyme